MQTEPTHSLDAAPDADAIDAYRSEADEAGDSIVVAYPSADGDDRYLVVSPRGTCAVLDDRSISIDSFNPDIDATEVANAL
jgi:hypothetical protein